MIGRILRHLGLQARIPGIAAGITSASSKKFVATANHRDVSSHGDRYGPDPTVTRAFRSIPGSDARRSGARQASGASGRWLRGAREGQRMGAEPAWSTLYMRCGACRCPERGSSGSDLGGRASRSAAFCYQPKGFRRWRQCVHLRLRMSSRAKLMTERLSLGQVPNVRVVPQERRGCGRRR